MNSAASAQKTKIRVYKIVVLGDGGVGKSGTPLCIIIIIVIIVIVIYLFSHTWRQMHLAWRDNWPSALRLRLVYHVYINDIDLVVENDMLKFADDTKLYGIFSDQAQAESLQNDLNGLTLWTSRWQMKFNTDKCLVMHIGARNIQYTYTMNGQVLQQVEAQSDLEVIIRKDLKLHISVQKHMPKPVEYWEWSAETYDTKVLKSC